jgi:hypothetical protein
MKIVVSRYNEDIEWTKPFGEHIVLYNKGEDTIDGAIVLPNVGREGHTYFHYICENYDCLDDYTVFLQGNPFPHAHDVCSRLHSFLNKPLHYNMDFQYLNTEQVMCNILHGCYWHPNLPIARVYETLFEKAATNRDITFNPGAQFIVSKERILKRPKAFYQKIVDMLGYHFGPDEGYAIERLHPLIFGDE